MLGQGESVARRDNLDHRPIARNVQRAGSGIVLGRGAFEPVAHDFGGERFLAAVIVVRPTGPRTWLCRATNVPTCAYGRCAGRRAC